MKITGVGPHEYDRAAQLWEASVRATHDFVTEADLDVFRPIVRGVFGQLEHLVGLRGDGAELIGFLGATAVDVNEQNTQALGFYLHEGFEVVSRSERDPMGKPYPILHLKLTG